MQIISGPYGHEKIHYEAPPSNQIPIEMERFLKWFNNSHHLTGPIRSEIALSQELGCPVLLSLSTTIQSLRKEYYDFLNKASLGNMDITPWLLWFTDLILESQSQAKKQIDFVLKKARFWDYYGSRLNERETKILNRMFRAGQEGFIKGMSAQKYAKIAICSKATATRDLTHLLTIGAFIKLEGGGRSTRYDIQLKI